MFIGKKKKLIETNNKIIVPFCKDCGSQQIKVTYTCEDCKSHNIKIPSIIDDIDDERAYRKETKEIEVYMYKCDMCGKNYEYNKELKPNTISFFDNCFHLGYITSDYNDNFTYTFKEDICEECLNKIINKLNDDINKIFKDNYINKIKDNIQSEIKETNIPIMEIYDFQILTLASPTQFLFKDKNNTVYYFRYRWGQYKLIMNYSTKTEEIILSGQYGDSLDGFMNVFQFIQLIKKKLNLKIKIMNFIKDSEE